jgi:uncharacterized SAM-binding protein YcdF (DUF218 family)
MMILSKERAKNRNILLILLPYVVVAIIGFCTLITFDFFPGRETLKVFLKAHLTEKLVLSNCLPNYFADDQVVSEKVIYILGGDQNSLTFRFKTAAELYQQHSAGKIITLSTPGITEYEPSLGRNLTNDEWKMDKLMALGVSLRDIELLSVEGGFFGTLREARTVSQVVLNRKYKTLILITSPYHALRAYKSFSKYLVNKGINIYIYTSYDDANVIGLLTEYFKLIFYDNVLLR